MNSNEKNITEELLKNLNRLRTRGNPDTDLIQSGSRRVFKGGPEITEDTDHDFIMMDTNENRSILSCLGFEDKYGDGLVNSGYGDSYSTAVFVKYFPGIEFENPCAIPVQVVLKTPESFERFLYFWEAMANNPKAFRELFWKRYTPVLEEGTVPDYPNTPEKIKERIEHWIEYVIPSFRGLQ